MRLSAGIAIFLLQFAVVSPLFALSASNYIQNFTGFVLTVQSVSGPVITKHGNVYCGQQPANEFTIPNDNQCLVSYTSSDGTISGMFNFWWGTMTNPCNLSYVADVDGFSYYYNTCPGNITLDSAGNIIVEVVGKKQKR